jgi:predicted small lipoprotein YifL
MGVASLRDRIVSMVRHPRPLARAAAILALAALAAGCGNKGPLTRPKPESPAATSAAPAAPTPADPAPARPDASVPRL